MAGVGPQLLGIPPLQHPRETPVTLGGLHSCVQDEHYVTEERMRGIFETIVREQIGEFHEMRRNMVAMVDRMTEMSYHLDTRVTSAEAQLSARQDSVTSEIQARDDQLRQHIDAASVLPRNEQFELLTKQLADQIATSEAGIASNLDAAVERLNACAAASVQETHSKSVALYEEMRRQMERNGHSPSEGKGRFSAGRASRGCVPGASTLSPR